MTETTLAQPLSATASSITLTDAGDLVKGDLLALEGEYCRILVVLTSKQALLQRGVNGTPATAHAAGVTVTVSVPEDFLTGPQQLPAFGIDTNVLTGLGPTAAATFQPASGGGGGAPADATYVVLSLNADLTAERVLTAGTNISFVDGGAGGLLTLNVASGAGGVSSIAGTANQITASSATGAVTLSIPTNPVFSGTALTFPGLLSIASGKTLTASNTLTFTGTDASSVAFGAGGTVLYTAGSGAALTFPGTLVIASGKTATINNTLTLAGTDSTTMTFPTTSATVARTDAANTFTGTQTFTGRLVIPSGSAAAPPIAFSDNTATGIYSNAPNGTIVAFTLNGIEAFEVGGGPSLYLNGANSSLVFNDVTIRRDAADTLALRNSTTAQTFNVYNTFTTFATAGEWAKFTWASNQFRFGAAAGSSSGTNRAASWDYGDKLASATAAITVPATSGNIVFGGGVQLSNAAATGLTPGVLAASTNASIVLYDSGGQAYRVPCII